MSAAYTLHLPRNAAPGDAEALERAFLVRDGFAWGAFLLPFAWFLRHGHFLLAALAFVVEIVIAVGLSRLGLRVGPLLLVLLLLHFLVGLEGASLRRLAYGWRRRPIADVVVAANMAEAELKAFARHLEAEPAAALRPIAPASQVPPLNPFVRREPEAVIGLFPQPERRP